MKAIKVMGNIDEDGQLTLDKPITTNKNSRVEVIVLIQEEVEMDEDDTPLEVIKKDFLQAWDEAISGKTINPNKLILQQMILEILLLTTNNV